MAAPRDRHSPSPARAVATQPPRCSRAAAARRTVRGRAPLEDVICRATFFAVSCTREQPAPKESLRLIVVKLSDPNTYTIAIFTHVRARRKPKLTGPHGGCVRVRLAVQEASHRLHKCVAL